MSVTRFAPSPTGRLHIGHAASAWFAFQKAKESKGHFLLRIEDIDLTRCKPNFIEGIYEDLHWLGLEWPLSVRLQSEHMDDYAAALAQLNAMGLLYPCFCTRKEILAEASLSASAPHVGEEGPLYSGTCRTLSAEERVERQMERPCVWRLDIKKAYAMTGPLVWYDVREGKIEAKPERFGDVVLARKDIATSYHLAVTVDDALQGVTLVTRGQDLFAVTDIHVLLQKLLGLPTPNYHHHPLLLDQEGKRFAKRDGARTIKKLREMGHKASDLIVGFKF